MIILPEKHSAMMQGTKSWFGTCCNSKNPRSEIVADGSFKKFHSSCGTTASLCVPMLYFAWRLAFYAFFFFISIGRQW